ncbi:MAG TPA: histidine phosphatase family protein [Chloroflexota bacterium]|jgi:phosphohistidine phosphatase|nr:histidine phosphatase family protein [Chloroflexota bacterium]
MDLYLLRHAEAGEAPHDEERRLTERGHRQARAAAAGIAWLDLGLNAILTSPLPRAAQTAHPIGEALRMRLESAPALATGRSPAEALALLTGRGDAVLLVGHEPQLSAIIQAITGGRVHMRKAMLARLEVESIDPPGGDLAWLLSWKHLERVGR